MELPRFLRPDEWSIEDHPHGWDLRCMPWPLSVGPRALLAVYLELSAVWLIWQYFRGPPIPVANWLVGALFVMLYQVLLYFACWNPNRQISARDGRVTCLAGTFPVGCLGSLRLSRSRRDRNRSRLVFTGTRVPEVELIGEPGLPDEAARQLTKEILGRVESALAGSSAESCEPDDAMDSRSSLRMNSNSWAAIH